MEEEEKMNRKNLCVNCNFFVLLDSYEDVDFGECRRYAPRPKTLAGSPERNSESVYAVWPAVVEWHWCGEFEPSKETA